MSGETFKIEKNNGERTRVKIVKDDYSMDLMLMTNGYQWTGAPINDELIDLLEEVIKEYKELDK